MFKYHLQVIILFSMQETAIAETQIPQTKKKAQDSDKSSSFPSLVSPVSLEELVGDPSQNLPGESIRESIETSVESPTGYSLNNIYSLQDIYLSQREENPMLTDFMKGLIENCVTMLAFQASRRHKSWYSEVKITARNDKEFKAGMNYFLDIIRTIDSHIQQSLLPVDPILLTRVGYQDHNARQYADNNEIGKPFEITQQNWPYSSERINLLKNDCGTYILSMGLNSEHNSARVEQGHQYGINLTFIGLPPKEESKQLSLF